MDHDLLGQQHSLVKTADGAEPQKAVLLNFGNNEANFVHVAGQHDFGLRACSVALFQHDQVT